MTVYAKKTQNVYVDTDIVELVAAKKLFQEGFDEKQMGPCAYDLRAGSLLTSRQRKKEFDISANAFILEPGEIATMQTIEKLNFEDPLSYALIYSSHTQLSQGFFHPTTSVDPGFTGPLTITVINLGTTGFPIKRGDRIAKMIISPVSPIPQRLYGDGQKPRVAEGSLEHSLYANEVSTPEGELEEIKFFSGPLKKLAERVDILEKDAELHQVKKEKRRMSFIILAIWSLLMGIIGALLTQAARGWLFPEPKPPQAQFILRPHPPIATGSSETQPTSQPASSPATQP